MKVTCTFGLLVGLTCGLSAPASAQQSNTESRAGTQRSQPWNDDDSETWREWWSDMWNEEDTDSKLEGRAGRDRSQGIISQYIDRYDEDGDDLLSKDELPQRLQSGFTQLDSNRDNKLSRAELREHANRRYRSRSSAPLELTYVWIIDTDQGRRNMEEIQQTYALLRKLDKNDDGKISRDEIRQLREHVVSKWCDECFDRLDENGDGELSKSEAKGSAFEEQFSQYDRNSDSQLTKSEIHRYVSQQFDSQSNSDSERNSRSEQDNSDRRRRDSQSDSQSDADRDSSTSSSASSAESSSQNSNSSQPDRDSADPQSKRSDRSDN